MPELDDIELPSGRSEELSLRPDRGGDSANLGSSPPVTDEPRRPSLWVAFVVLAALIAGVAYFIYGRHPLPVEQERTARAAEPPPPAAPPAEPLPALDASDALVRTLLQQLSSNPQLAQWLTTNDLVRKFATIVDRIAIGTSPAKVAAFARPSQPFRAAGSGDSLHIDPQSYDRYNTLAAVVDSLDVDGAARAYQRLKPLMNQAYRELGYPDEEIDRKLSMAIARLLDTPVPNGPVALKATSVSYQFADPDLESLSSPQKQLLRMGPHNMQLVQAKLRAFAKAAGLTQQSGTR
jgi:Protein of unknown function (DUF3014)